MRRREAERGPRAERSAGTGYCRLHSLNVSLARFFLSPRELDIRNCYGPCTFPLVADVSPTRHAAALNSAIHAGVDVGRAPCCMPVEYADYTVLDLTPEGEGHELVVLKSMVATKCGCR